AAAAAEGTATDEPQTVLLPSAGSPPPMKSTAQRRGMSVAGILMKLLVLLVIAAAGFGGYFGYERWVKPRLHRGGSSGLDTTPLAPLAIAKEPDTEGSLRRAIAADPTDTANYEKLAALLETQGRKDEASLYRAAKEAARPAPAATVAASPAPESKAST